MNEPIWTPAPERVAASNLTRFAEFARRRYGAPDGAYATLWRWSVTERERFWQALIEFAGVIRDDGTGPVLRDRDRGADGDGQRARNERGQGMSRTKALNAHHLVAGLAAAVAAGISAIIFRSFGRYSGYIASL